jgi:hypothetical protein
MFVEYKKIPYVQFNSGNKGVPTTMFKTRNARNAKTTDLGKKTEGDLQSEDQTIHIKRRIKTGLNLAHDIMMMMMMMTTTTTTTIMVVVVVVLPGRCQKDGSSTFPNHGKHPSKGLNPYQGAIIVRQNSHFVVA